MQQFGTKQTDQEYVLRPSVYVVLFDQQGRLLIVLHNGRYFLPGGGVEDGESFADAARREMMEEVGWSITIGDEFATAGEYVRVPEDGASINKVGHFYLGRIVAMEGAGTEKDHEPRWVTVDEFEAGAAHESHVWAVRCALDLPRN